MSNELVALEDCDEIYYRYFFRTKKLNVIYVQNIVEGLVYVHIIQYHDGLKKQEEPLSRLLERSELDKQLQKGHYKPSPRG